MSCNCARCRQNDEDRLKNRKERDEKILKICSECTHQVCCRGVFWIPLFKEIDSEELFKKAEFSKRHNIFILKKKKDKSCIYLDRKGKCSCWDIRPKECRNYFCRYIT
jgi:hypothetical protein